MDAQLEARQTDWVEVEDFFYQEMLAGWAADAITTADTLNGFKSIISGPSTPLGRKYLLVDRWATYPGSSHSAGMTLIYRQSKKRHPALIWTMHYRGSYSSRGTSIVRAALNEAYRFPDKHEWVAVCGCRGPWRMHYQGLSYRNEVRSGSTFRNFGGREEVVDRETGKKSEGYHEYFGGSLF